MTLQYLLVLRDDVNLTRGSQVLQSNQSHPLSLFDRRSSQEREDLVNISSFNDLTDQLEHLAHGARALLGHSGGQLPALGADLETITSQRHLDGVFSDLQHRARESVDAFDYGMHGPETKGQSGAQPPALARGVRYRVIYDPSVFKRESLREAMLLSVRQGEEARVSTIVPTRTLIGDRTECLVFSRSPEQSGFLAIRSESAWFAEFLNETFESIWRSALPLTNERLEDSRLLTEDEMDILRLLAAGLTDESIARSSGVSVRTIQRKVQAIQRHFGASSRFQLGAMSGLQSR